MERLTQKDEQGNWTLRGVPWKQLHEGQVITKELWERLYGALWKLMEYEDIGLSPEEIEEIKAGNILNMDNKSILLRQREDGTWEEKPEPYAVIECETEEDFNYIKQRLKSTEWIPVEERLPVAGETVWATVKHSEWISDYGTDWLPEEEKKYHPESYGVYKAEYIGGGIWQYSDDYNEWIYCDAVEKEERNLANVYDTVTAWMPLPEPYRGEKEN